jgi:capsule polysaccharide export protein KpsE/RkpR
MDTPSSGVSPRSNDQANALKIYGYFPSLHTAIAFTALFTVLAAVHVLYFFIFGRKKSTTSSTPTVSTRVLEALIIIGCVLQMVGFAFRIGTQSNPYTLRNYIVTYVFIAIVSYMTLSAAHPY